MFRQLKGGGLGACKLVDQEFSDSVNDWESHPPTDARTLLEDGKQLAPGGTRVPYKAWWSLGRELDRFEQEQRDSEKSEKTIEGYRWALRNGFRALWNAGYDLNPRRFDQAQLDYLKNTHWKDISHNARVSNITPFRTFLRWAGNKQVDRLRWPVRNGMRPNADWLSEEDAMVVRREARGLGRIVVHLELDLMMRRVEVLRSELRHFESGRTGIVRVKGKGRHGGKERSISWHPDTAEVLDLARTIREVAIGHARAKDPTVKVPDALLLYECGGGLGTYKKSALDGIVRQLSRTTGIPFSHHTLRRTGARMLYFSLLKEEPGHALEKVQYVLGHSDPRTTGLYLGIRADDVAHAMELYGQYQKAVKIPEKGISDTSQQDGGPCGIRVCENDWIVVENSNPRNHLPRSAVEK